ncbi:DNA alkylation repair protein [uncultured Muribaculum sp.]|uniref:DNA alkylation repair protein n=1 Tax=uncultured Muribaculum sp. TaxID=1918613 RepID=UPI0025D82470|nr:DNA alkylation repair protein [uncultured Muribaculum sp.]
MDAQTARRLQPIKHRFYAMRNGITADVLRRVGAPYRMIFGVNLPHLKEIASEIVPDASLARDLWGDASTRESVLLATMVMPPEEFTLDEARRWLATATSAEAIDLLCLRLLGRKPFAAQVAQECLASGEELMRYAAMRLQSYL